MFRLAFKIEGEQQMSRKLMIAANKIKDWTPAFQQTAELLKKTFSEDVFASQGAVIQEHWSPLKKAYALQKSKKYPGQGLLVASGAMKNAFATISTKDMAAIWNTTDYFKYHQSNQPRKKLPRRVMMKLGNTQKERVVKVFHTYFQKALEK